MEQATEREQLYIMLALNCGMYQSDIGRLTLDEINVDDGYVFWDREKQPRNPFKVRHNFWPETLAIAQKYIQQANRRSRFVDDYRHGKLERIDCARFAFTDDAGNPLYRILPSGKCYDKIGKAIGRLNARAKKQQVKFPRFKFNHLRKSTNQLLREAVGRANAGDAKGLTAIEEMSQMYLAQRDGLLTRLYSQTREISSATTIYSAMNQFLGKAGDELRCYGVFWEWKALIEPPDRQPINTDRFNSVNAGDCESCSLSASENASAVTERQEMPDDDLLLLVIRLWASLTPTRREMIRVIVDATS